jgi:hypothetical protein
MMRAHIHVKTPFKPDGIPPNNHVLAFERKGKRQERIQPLYEPSADFQEATWNQPANNTSNRPNAIHLAPFTCITIIFADSNPARTPKTSRLAQQRITSENIGGALRASMMIEL